MKPTPGLEADSKDIIPPFLLNECTYCGMDRLYGKGHSYAMQAGMAATHQCMKVESSLPGGRESILGVTGKGSGPQTENQMMGTALSQQDSGLRNLPLFLGLDAKVSQGLTRAPGWWAEISRVDHHLQKSGMSCEPDELRSGRPKKEQASLPLPSSSLDEASWNFQTSLLYTIGMAKGE